MTHEHSCKCQDGCEASARTALVRRGLRLEYLAVGRNVIEGIVSVAAALTAGSLALLGFGIDSFVETTSGLVLIRRLAAERRARNPEEIERLDQRAHELVGLSLFLLAAYIAFDAVRALIARERPELLGTSRAGWAMRSRGGWNPNGANAQYGSEWVDPENPNGEDSRAWFEPNGPDSKYALVSAGGPRAPAHTDTPRVTPATSARPLAVKGGDWLMFPVRLGQPLVLWGPFSGPAGRFQGESAC